MENERHDEIPPELQVWVDTEISLEGRSSPQDHQKIQSALENVPGVESLSFVLDRVALRYDPERVTGSQLRDLIEKAGFRVSEVETAPSDPVADHLGNDDEQGPDNPDK